MNPRMNPTPENRRDPAWRQRHGFESIEANPSADGTVRGLPVLTWQGREFVGARSSQN